MISAIRVVSGTIEVDTETFIGLMSKKEDGFVVASKSGVFSSKYQYQLYLDGFTFYTEAKSSLPIPSGVTVILAEKIFSPIKMVP